MDVFILVPEHDITPCVLESFSKFPGVLKTTHRVGLGMVKLEVDSDQIKEFVEVAEACVSRGDNHEPNCPNP